MPRQILVDWTTSAGGGQVSVFNFLEADPVAGQRTALSTFLTSCQARLASTTTWSIRTTGVEYDSTTGALTGAWAEGTAHTGTGAIAVQAADATQLLVQWKTAVIKNGRFVRGRTFLPGVATGDENNGNVGSSTLTAINAAAATFVGATTPPFVWSRPVSGSGGQLCQVTAGTAWAEFAVLRRRRK